MHPSNLVAREFKIDVDTFPRERIIVNRPDPLPYNVTFVCRRPELWPELFDNPTGTLPDPENLVERQVLSENNCVIRTYLYLKHLNYNVAISNRLVPGDICVINNRDWGLRTYAKGSFIISCRMDSWEPVLSDFTVVQSECNVQSPSHAFIPLWHQPNLIPRSDERGSRIETVAYKGAKLNIYKSFYSDEFIRRLEEIGVRLVLNCEDEVNLWNDYRTTDIFLAVRDMTEGDALIKPPTKLINAWVSGVPALLGPEPSFLRLKRCDLDFIEVRTPDEAFTAIRRLQENPDLYGQMVANGRLRARDFAVDRIVKRWVDILSGPVAEKYGRWRKKSAASRLLRVAMGAFKYKQAKARYNYHVHHGYRPVSMQFT